MQIDSREQNIEQIITADWLIPMNQANHWLEHHAIVITGNKITDILHRDQAIDKYPQAPITTLNGQVLMPGFVNSHCHAAMNLLRGLSDDLPLKEWLEQAIWPVEAQFVDDTFVYQGTQHAIAEMIRSGTTCFQDMYFMPNQIAKAAQESGIRANIGLVVVEFETSWAKNAQECIDKGLDVFDQFKHSNTINFNFAPHAPYTVSKNTLEKLGTLSNELNLTLQIHVHETANEVESFVAEHGIRPLARLKEIGLLSPLLNAVHMTQLNEGEIEWLAESACHVIHCPQSNMKLASGVCPTIHLIEAGVNLAIGTDGAASNNDLDMIDETRSASLLAKLDYLNPTALTAYQSLYAATMGGAKAMGLQEKIGSLEVGKAADIIAIDLNRIETQPVYNPISQIVYAASRDQVTNVWVNGKQLLKDRELSTLNSPLILQHAQNWRHKIINR
ncbi:TRZ/ATZ family hydrolase [Aliikangiella coralliicola]|uniref:5-methylthioadenosine/S-adenosylhomocysteine deaminase n=1 Tax=Aliikangiella coralliicola TaxID=2592383 RepID=A0A545U4Y9_9GAMM|nr:TRZ/ATZ family hydrolase [Aliikangiella coralliicola]TQV84514.1 TRZ/ATZ family hydrolase [Aliikangiella coralliicola]